MSNFTPGAKQRNDGSNLNKLYIPHVFIWIIICWQLLKSRGYYNFIYSTSIEFFLIIKFCLYLGSRDVYWVASLSLLTFAFNNNCIVVCSAVSSKTYRGRGVKSYGSSRSPNDELHNFGLTLTTPKNRC